MYISNKFQADGIHTVPHSRRSRTVIKNMSQMGIASFTQYFGPFHSVCRIPFIIHPFFIRFKKTRPAAAA